MAAELLLNSRELGHVLILYNKTGNINQELFGKFVLLFWFKDLKDHHRYLVTCDGASGHSYNISRKIAKL